MFRKLSLLLICSLLVPVVAQAKLDSAFTQIKYYDGQIPTKEPRSQQTRAVYRPDPVFSKLKAYRTYFQIDQVSEYTHRFDAWFVSVELMRCSISVEKKEDIVAITEDDLRCVYGGLVADPTSLPPLPEDKKSWKGPIEKKLNELFEAGVKKLKLAYAGEFRLIDVTETIQTGNPTGNIFRRDAKRSDLAFTHEKGTDVLEPYGMQSFGGSTYLCFDTLPSYCEKSPSFVDFALTASIEGSSFLYGNSRKASKDYTDQWAEFSKKVVETADQIKAGTYENPIKAILERQGDTLLPKGLNSFATFDITTYARHSDFQKQVRDDCEFRFALKGAFESGLETTVKAKETKLVYFLWVSLKDMTIAFEIDTPDGENVVVEAKLEGEFLRSGDDIAIDGNKLKVKLAEGDKHLTLPSSREFTIFDIYPKTRIRTDNLFVQEVPPWR